MKLIDNLKRRAIAGVMSVAMLLTATPVSVNGGIVDSVTSSTDETNKATGTGSHNNGYGVRVTMANAPKSTAEENIEHWHSNWVSPGSGAFIVYWDTTYGADPGSANWTLGSDRRGFRTMKGGGSVFATSAGSKNDTIYNAIMGGQYSNLSDGGSLGRYLISKESIAAGDGIGSYTNQSLEHFTAACISIAEAFGQTGAWSQYIDALLAKCAGEQNTSFPILIVEPCLSFGTIGMSEAQWFQEALGTAPYAMGESFVDSSYGNLGGLQYLRQVFGDRVLDASVRNNCIQWFGSWSSGKLPTPGVAGWGTGFAVIDPAGDFSNVRNTAVYGLNQEASPKDGWFRLKAEPDDMLIKEGDNEDVTVIVEFGPQPGVVTSLESCTLKDAVLTGRVWYTGETDELHGSFSGSTPSASGGGFEYTYEIRDYATILALFNGEMNIEFTGGNTTGAFEAAGKSRLEYWYEGEFQLTIGCGNESFDLTGDPADDPASFVVEPEETDKWIYWSDLPKPFTQVKTGGIGEEAWSHMSGTPTHLGEDDSTGTPSFGAMGAQEYYIDVEFQWIDDETVERVFYFEVAGLSGTKSYLHCADDIAYYNYQEQLLANPLAPPPAGPAPEKCTAGCGDPTFFCWEYSGSFEQDWSTDSQYTGENERYGVIKSPEDHVYAVKHTYNAAEWVEFSEEKELIAYVRNELIQLGLDSLYDVDSIIIDDTAPAPFAFKAKEPAVPGVVEYVETGRVVFDDSSNNLGSIAASSPTNVTRLEIKLSDITEALEIQEMFSQEMTSAVTGRTETLLPLTQVTLYTGENVDQLGAEQDKLQAYWDSFIENEVETWAEAYWEMVVLSDYLITQESTGLRPFMYYYMGGGNDQVEGDGKANEAFIDDPNDSSKGSDRTFSNTIGDWKVTEENTLASEFVADGTGNDFLENYDLYTLFQVKGASGQQVVAEPADWITFSGYNGNYGALSTTGSGTAQYTSSYAGFTDKDLSYYYNDFVKIAHRDGHLATTVPSSKPKETVALSESFSINDPQGTENGEYYFGASPVNYSSFLIDSQTLVENGGPTLYAEYYEGSGFVNSNLVHNPTSCQYATYIGYDDWDSGFNAEELDQRVDTLLNSMPRLDLEGEFYEYGALDTEYLDNFIMLDSVIKIDFPYTGDFAGGSSYGLAATEDDRVYPLVNGFDTKDWTFERYITFDFHVDMLPGSYNPSSDDVSVYAQVTAGTPIPLNEYYSKDQEEFYFYVPLANSEASAATIQFETVATNWRVHAQDANATEHNPDKINANLAAPHTTIKTQTVDIVGRIGNMSIVDSKDYRYSIFFKDHTMEGLVPVVDESVQVNYIGDSTTILGDDISDVCDNLNTYGQVDYKSSTPLPFPLTSAYLEGTIYEDREVGLGYDTFFDIETIGNYYGATIIDQGHGDLEIETGNGTTTTIPGSSGGDTLFDTLVQVQPYYFWVDGEDVDYAAGTLSTPIYYDGSNASTANWFPIDVYANVSGSPILVNEFASQYNPPVNTFTYIDWTKDFERAMMNTGVTDAAIDWWDDIRTSWAGQLVVPNKDTAVLTYQGTYQRLQLREDARSFMGSNVVNSSFGCDLDTNPFDAFSDDYYSIQGQRWHFMLGLPSSSMFTIAGEEWNEEFNDRVYNSGCIVMALRILARGEVWTLDYNKTNTNITEFDVLLPDPENPGDPDKKITIKVPNWKIKVRNPNYPKDPDEFVEIPDPYIVIVYDTSELAKDDLVAAGTH